VSALFLAGLSFLYSHFPPTLEEPIATFTFRQGDLPRLDLQVDRGTDFTAWQTQWDIYSSLSRLNEQMDEKQVHLLLLQDLNYNPEPLNIERQ